VPHITAVRSINLNDLDKFDYIYIYQMLLSILDINRSGYGAVNPPNYASASRVYASGGGGHKSVEPSS